MENLLTAIVTIIIVGVIALFDHLQLEKLSYDISVSSDEADFFVEQITQQSSLDEVIEVFQFSIVHHQIWQKKIPHRIFKYHITCIVEAYKHKIDQFQPINLN